jgi:hypothetical protein
VQSFSHCVCHVWEEWSRDTHACRFSRMMFFLIASGKVRKLGPSPTMKEPRALLTGNPTGQRFSAPSNSIPPHAAELTELRDIVQQPT